MASVKASPEDEEDEMPSAQPSSSSGSGDNEEESEEEQEEEDEDHGEEAVEEGDGEEEEEEEEEEEDGDGDEEGEDENEDEEQGTESEEEEEVVENEEEDENPHSPKDGSRDVESDKVGEDPRATSIILEKSKQSLVSHGQEIGGCDDDLPTVNESVELAEQQCKEVSCVDSRNYNPSNLERSTALSDENRLLESSLECTNEVPVVEKIMSIGASDNVVQNDVSEIHNSVQNDGTTGNNESLCVKEDEAAVGALCRDHFGDGEPGGISCSDKEMKSTQMENDIQSAVDLKINASSSCTPRQRPRSLTPDAELGNTSKRPAVLCSFFARGWCIKGNSCKFLHQKPGFGNAEKWTKENVAGAELVSSDHAGSRLTAERSRLSISVDPSDADNALHLSEKVLSQEYGQSEPRHMFHEGGGLSSVQREGLFPRSYNSSSSIREDLLKFDSHAKGWSIETPSLYGKVNPRLNVVDVRQFGNQDIIPRNYPEAVRMHHEIPKGVLLNDTLSARGSTSSLPMPFSSGSFIPSRIFGDGGTAIHSTIQKQPSHAAFPGVCAASTLNNSLMTGFSTSLRSINVSPLHQGTGFSTHGSPFVAENLSSRNLLDYDKRLSTTSRSASMPRSSSPYYSRSGSEDLPGSSGFRTTLSHSYDWEPSVPFRSSFHFPPAGISSPGSPYDPLVDSISSPGKASAFSQGGHSQNTMQHQPNGEPASSRSRSPGYNAEKCLQNVHESREGSFDKNVYREGIGGFTTEVEPEGKYHIADVETRSSTPKAGNPLSNHDDMVGSANIDGMDLDLNGNAKHQIEKSRHSKNSKAMKLFHAALVDFVKELVKPHWREGHLSKDAHKMIVKKAVDKVLGTLRSHQIPSSTESIKEYLTSSRPKLAKLVDGYVEKYAKS